MCGIFGYVAKQSLNDEAILKSLSRRGPDGRGCMTLPWCGQSEHLRCTLLHTRLAIIDLCESANQPMVDVSNNYVIIFNGEIYNYRDLRIELEKLGHRFLTQSDTEVLLYGYIRWGEGVLNRLRGMFAFCIYDNVGQKLFIARDHFGQKPLYYYQRGDMFCFSSSISAIFASGAQDRFTLSRDAIRYYLAFGSFISPDTILTEVKSLLPGHYLTYHAGSIQIMKYYDLEQQVSDSSDDKEELLRKLRGLMFDSVEKHMIADVPVGIFLSGGIDSSIIAGIASRVSKERIHTYSIGFKDGQSSQDETAVASKTARFLNSIHENILLDQQDFNVSLEEFLNAIDVPSVDGLNTFFISKAIGPRIKVILSGLGGDEMFAGYPVFHQIQELQHPTRIDGIVNRLPVKVLNRIGKDHLRYVGYSLFDILIEKRLIGELEDKKRTELRKYVVNNASPLKTVSIFEISNYMANVLLRDTDAVTMHHSLECRVPFVDRHVFAFAMSVSDTHKVRRGLNKPLLVETFSDLMIEETYKLPKRGFTLPVSIWMRRYLSDKRDDEIQQLAFDYNIFPYECPFDNNRKQYNSKETNNYYKWMILLKWIGKNMDKLSSCQAI